MTDPVAIARERWEAMYAEGFQLAYPNDVFVRVTHRVFDPATIHTIYDHGCGSGENLLHLAQRGFSMTGADISASAIETTRRRAVDAGVDVEVAVLDDLTLPFDDDSFDASYSWQVLTYNTPDTLATSLGELLRITRPGGRLLVTFSAPSDYMHVHGTPIGDDVYTLDAAGQEGTTIMIVPEARIATFFPGRAIEVGWFGHDFADRPSKHWIVSVVV